MPDFTQQPPVPFGETHQFVVRSEGDATVSVDFFRIGDSTERATGSCNVEQLLQAIAALAQSGVNSLKP
jgi:hypothetical protein